MNEDILKGQWKKYGFTKDQATRELDGRLAQLRQPTSMGH